MDFRHLNYFKKVAELQHITQAANELMIAQPALSRVIRQLEDELNAPLFDRNGKHIVLNSNGEILYKYVAKIFDLLEQAKHEININHSANTCNILLTLNSGSSVIPVMAGFFQRKYPDIHLRFVRNQPIQEGEICCHFDSHFKYTPSVHSIPLFQEKCLLAFSENHRFAHMKNISPHDLKGETFLYSDNCHSTKAMASYLTGLAGFEPAAQLECLGNESVLSFLKSNLGIALIPSLTWNMKFYPTIQTYEFPDLPLCRTFHMDWSGPWKHSQQVQCFQEFCISFFHKIQELNKTHDILHEDLLELYSSHISSTSK